MSIIGRPSTGKSSFVNRVVGHKTVIVSPLPQTTQKSIRGIYNENRGQIIFLDTPGIHQSEQRFNQSLNSQATSTIQESDLVIYMADISRMPGQEEEDIVTILGAYQKNLLLVLNKIDQERTYHSEYVLFFEKYWPGKNIHYISIVTGEGIEDLKNILFENLPEGPLLYPEDVYTDQEPSFRIAEIIREQAINRVREEVPHSIYVEIADLEMQKDFLWIRAFLMVERETQKGMLVGKKGAIIHSIKMASLKGIKKLFNSPIKLDLQVKVDKEWRKNNHRLKSLFG
ncbi:MAG: GTPase Era [Spirochaetia bacterium]